MQPNFVVYERLDFSENLSSFLSAPIASYENFPIPCRRKLVLLHTGRCGSTLLHYLLRPFVCPPFEAFNPHAIGPILGESSVMTPIPLDLFLQKYLRVVYPDEKDLNENMVLSLSLTPWMLGGVEKISPGFSSWLLRDSITVVLLRKNIIRQALSYALAEQRDFWHSINGEKPEKKISEDEVSRTKVLEYLDLILWAECRLAFSPLRDAVQLTAQSCFLEYEDFAENPEGTCLRILKMLDIDVASESLHEVSELPERIATDFDMDLLSSRYIDEMPIMLPSKLSLDLNLLSARPFLRL